LEVLTFIMFIILIIASAQYGFHILAGIGLAVYFILQRSWVNVFLLLVYFASFLIFNGNLDFAIISSIILLVIMVLSNFFGRKQKSSSSDDMADFSKLFGGGGGA